MRTTEIGTSAVRCCLALLLAVIFACTAAAQSTTDGAVGGTITDSSGAAVPNAKITVKNNGTNAEQTVMTDDTGYFRVGKLQPAAYTVSIDAQGFAPFKAEMVIVQLGSVTDVSARLNVASAGATVVVSAEVPQVQLSGICPDPRPERHQQPPHQRRSLVQFRFADSRRGQRCQRLRTHQLPRHEHSSK